MSVHDLNTYSFLLYATAAAAAAAAAATIAAASAADVAAVAVVLSAGGVGCRTCCLLLCSEVDQSRANCAFQRWLMALRSIRHVAKTTMQLAARDTDDCNRPMYAYTCTCHRLVDECH